MIWFEKNFIPVPVKYESSKMAGLGFATDLGACLRIETIERESLLSQIFRSFEAKCVFSNKNDRKI